ncbi:spermidine/putrescine ABC transporter ATP-binding protein [Bacillus sp. FJAT-27225]|uniref:ABC transporter ATP-binding protein n=1 Tax=Bacillus sp. FJAT-27225 TaxID=1743144 RepID=UPI00080C24A7|nr:ABC transporter ATP-binding protein [Bacillus sp. FJAT-27225]OCA91457.1 spermidine/putrescine ABC transporter ATP-binding protein [Bacillus sp. FJAT-27225]
MSLLSLEGVGHTYFTKDMAVTAISDISLSVEEGEFISFLGPSGCGKTTLLSIIAGLIEQTEGKVLLGGKPIEDARDDIGYMLQQDYLFPWKTIEENVLIGLKLTKKLTPERRARALKLLQDIGLPGVEKKLPKQLSGGMRQRAALARTLTAEPKVLMLDEPFSALDYQSKLKLEDLVLSTLKGLGKTAILVTHDIGEAIAMSDRIYLFSASPGRIHKVFHIPDELRKLQPFETRNHESYGKLFKEIWKELESLE